MTTTNSSPITVSTTQHATVPNIQQSAYGTTYVPGSPGTPGTLSPNGYVYREFGNSFSTSGLLLSAPGSTEASMSLVMKDYEKAKAQHFPNWGGFPEIRTAMTDPLNRYMQIGWYCIAPDESGSIVTDEMEDELWES